MARVKQTLRILLIGLALSLLTRTPASAAELKLPAMFTSGAVLQQEMAVPVWGWAAPNAEVQVAFAGQTKTAKADEIGLAVGQGNGRRERQDGQARDGGSRSHAVSSYPL